MPQVWVDAIAAFVAEYVAEKIGGAEVAKAQHSNLEHESSKILDLPASPLIREGGGSMPLEFPGCPPGGALPGRRHGVERRPLDRNPLVLRCSRSGGEGRGSK